MFRRLLIVFMLILAIALVACGSGDEPEPVERAGDSAAEPVTATSEPPTATPVEPTATSEPPPTPTLAPTPTEAAEETQPEDDQSGSADVAADSGSAANGSGWGASGGGSQTACDHPYLPLRSGGTWTYDNGQDTLIWEVTDVQGDMNEATAVVSITVGNVTIDYQWQCVAGEGLASFDFANLASVPGGLNLTLEQVSVDGHFLLPPEQLVPGASWTTEMESKISFQQEVEGTSFEATGDMTTMQQNTIKSADPVEVNGQSVPGLQVEQTNEINMVLSLMGTAMEQAMTLGSEMNLGYGVGIVNQTSTTDFGTEVMRLVEYSIP
jgi:hypothetical protein